MTTLAAVPESALDPLITFLLRIHPLDDGAQQNAASVADRHQLGTAAS